MMDLLSNSKPALTEVTRWSATATTIACFLMGIPICLKIRKKGDTKDISSFPFVISLISTMVWFRYAVMQGDIAMIITNVLGLFLYILYNLFYLIYTGDKGWLTIQYALVCVVDYTMLLLVTIYEPTAPATVGKVLGSFAAFIQIITFGSPLAGVVTVFKDRSTATLPLPLIVSFVLVTFQWMLYGILKEDLFVIISNGVGLVLGLFQLSLFLIFPADGGDKVTIDGALEV